MTYTSIPIRNTNFKGPVLSTTGTLASAAWKGTGASIQANIIGVESNLNGFHGGGWVDGWFRGEVVDHNASLLPFGAGAALG